MAERNPMNLPVNKSRRRAATEEAVQQTELPLWTDTAKPERPAPSIRIAKSTVNAAELEPGPLDERFAQLMLRLAGTNIPELSEAARMVSAARRKGHVCLPVQSLPSATDGIAEKLLATNVVGHPGDRTPLILDESGRLYLHRYWRYEQDLAAEIRARIATEPPALNRNLLNSGLDQLFGPKPGDQRAAAEKALSGNFCVITGGPGTGKTRTVARILALLQAQFAAAGKHPSIALAAPTGKAAARMTESIRNAISELRGDAIASELADVEAVTLHRLLGCTPDAPVPRFDARNPLPVDAIIVDEASMIDLALMAKLFAAVQRNARIILLGDKDQLASVEAGHVLGEICQPSDSGNPRLAGQIAELRHSFRFATGSGIDRFSRSVNAGEEDEAVALLREGAPGITAASLPPPDLLSRLLKERVTAGYRDALTASDPATALGALSQYRILCAVRKGPYGVETLNLLANQALAEAGLIIPGSVFYHGRPILILRNDYPLRLFNGDTGIILRDPKSGNALRAFFQGTDGRLRRITPARLPEHETVWAMTVHKSQGSEFDRILFVLPDRESPLLTRELLYTAVTRSRTASEIWYREEVLRSAIRQRTERRSGLADVLWKRAAIA